MLSALLAPLRRAFPRVKPAAPRGPRRFRPRLAELEGRDVPTAGLYGLDGNHTVTEGGDLLFKVIVAGKDPDGGTVNFTVTRNSGSGPDFTGPMTGSVTFARLDCNPKPIRFHTNDDKFDEDTETFTVTLTGATRGGTIYEPAASATGEILDNDDPPYVIITGPELVSESVGRLNHYARLSVPSEKEVTVFYQAEALASETMHVGTDLAAPAGKLVFAPSDSPTSLPIHVGVVDDDIVEPAERFAVQVTAATNAGINPVYSFDATTVRDNDRPKIAVFAATTTMEGSDVTPTFMLLNAAEVPVTIHYWTRGQTARSGTDYTGVDATLTFNGTQFEQAPVTIKVADNEVRGPVAKSFLFNFSCPGAVFVGRTAQTTITILDDDGE